MNIQSPVALNSIGVALLLGVCGAPGVFAGGPPAGLPPFTPQREQAALEFVAQHHPELSSVLVRLEHANRGQYEQAIRELFDTRRRLSLVKPKDEALYDLLLEGWKTQSRAEVLAARLAFAKEENPVLEDELRALIARKVELERQTIEHNRQKTLQMLEGMQKSLDWYDENRDTIIQRRIKSLTNRSKKSGVRPPAKKAAPDDRPLEPKKSASPQDAPSK